MEQGYHSSLVGRSSILQAEWHDIVGVSSPMGGEHCLGFVLFSHLNLITTQEPVYDGEEYVGHGVINQGIDVWQGKVILQASPIQISIIDTHAYFPVFLWHENNVRNLIKIGYGNKKPVFNYFSTSSLIFRIIFDFILWRA